MADLKENVIEWITGDETITCTLTQRKYINKVQKMTQQTPEKVQIIVENPDGSIVCHLPLKALKLSIITREGTGFARKEAIEPEE